MKDQELKNIFKSKIEEWESGKIIAGEPQPSEMVWDKVRTGLPSSSMTLPKLIMLYTSVAAMSFGLGFLANEVLNNKAPEPTEKMESQQTIAIEGIENSETQDSSQRKIKRTIEIIDMDSIEAAKEKDYIIYNNAKIYKGKKDSTDTAIDSTSAETPKEQVDN